MIQLKFNNIGDANVANLFHLIDAQNDFSLFIVWQSGVDSFQNFLNFITLAYTNHERKAKFVAILFVQVGQYQSLLWRQLCETGCRLLIGRFNAQTVCIEQSAGQIGMRLKYQNFRCIVDSLQIVAEMC